MANTSFLLPADPKAGYLAYKEEIDQAVQRVLDSGWYIFGQEVSAFEREFAGYLGAQHAIGTGSGTEALHLALLTCGIGSGDAVITVSHTAVATVAAIELAGATPVLVDVDPVTFTIDPNQVEDTLRNSSYRFKAIIPVHLYGHPADMPTIMDIARRHNLYVIEDCAQAHGASVQARRTGTWGDMAAFSFYPTKNLGALGDAGAVVTNDPALAERAHLLQQYGWQKRYISDLPGMNTRLDELQAAVLRVKLQHLDKETSRRQEVAWLYDTLLSATSLTLPESRSEVEHVYHQYVVRHTRRDDLGALLKENSIGTAVLYPVPVHLQPAYRDRVPTHQGQLFHTELLCNEILCLPMFPQLTDDQVHRVIEMIIRWHEHSARGCD